MANPLHVVFIWHLHQPFYKDTETGQYSLPWVRLHAAKDYLHLAEIIRDYPDVHQTINVVPSLLEQLEDYAAGRAVDPALAVSQKSHLTREDKRYLLEHFFSINWDRFVWPVPRYAQLARLREAANGAVELFGDAFWTDLIVWFNLAWIDPSARRRDPRLRALVEKGENFDQSDVATVLAFHQEACAKVIPAYRQLAEQGQVELSTTPFFHPILPLIIDTRSAREARPNVELPRIGFRHRDDALEHLERAIRLHEKVFGHRPRGIWPAEGAVSQAMIELVSTLPDLRWIATDEHVLARALGTRFDRDGYGHLLDPSDLCQPYRVRGLAPTVFFRDQTLSDRIGFVYQHMDSVAAADDLVDRLLHVSRKLESDQRPHVVSIILDGENCWEAYPNNGDDFLRRLFERLSAEPRLRTATPSEVIDQFGTTPTLERLPAGSWIGSNFDTWIGEPDQNRAWDYLALARSSLMHWEKIQQPSARDEGRRERAWHALLVAEGSDWFWWYYSRNRFGDTNPFDVAFRQHLANVYRVIGEDVPAWLSQPIDGHAPERRRDVTDLMTLPTLSGDSQASVEWAVAGFVEPETSTGAMQQGTTFFRRLYFGFDATSLYFRIETIAPIDGRDLLIYLGAQDLGPANRIPRLADGSGDGTKAGFGWQLRVSGRPGQPVRAARADGGGRWVPSAVSVEAVVGENAAEVRVPWADLGLAWGSNVYVTASAMRDGETIEALPSRCSADFRLVERHAAGRDGSPAEGVPRA